MKTLEVLCARIHNRRKEGFVQCDLSKAWEVVPLPTWCSRRNGIFAPSVTSPPLHRHIPNLTSSLYNWFGIQQEAIEAVWWCKSQKTGNGLKLTSKGNLFYSASHLHLHRLHTSSSTQVGIQGIFRAQPIWQIPHIPTLPIKLPI